MADADEVLREVFRDQVRRVRELVEQLTDDLPEAVATWRPDAEANTVAWLLWHLARVEDDHVAGLAGTDQVWTAQDWYERSGLPFEPGDIGYGQSADEVTQVRLDAGFLRDYHAAVHEAALAYVDRLDATEVRRVVDEGWDPPVTAGVRLVSLIGDCLQHAGQASYVAGLAARR